MEGASLYSMAGKSAWFTVQGYYAESFYSYKMKRHSHKRIEVMYAVSGSFITEIQSKEKWKSVCVRSGELIIIDAGTPHSLLLPENSEARILNLELEVNHNDASAFSMRRLCAASEGVGRMLGDVQPYLKFIDNHDLQKIIHAVHREMQMGDSAPAQEREYMLNLLLAQFWISVARCYGERFHTGALYYYVKKALEYIETYYNNNITVEDVAEYAGVHFSYLQKIFKQNTGSSVMNYVNKVRIKRACSLLLNSDMPIEKIAPEVGFNSRQNFLYTFKGIMGVTPREYRLNADSSNVRCFYQDPLSNTIEE